MAEKTVLKWFAKKEACQKNFIAKLENYLSKENIKALIKEFMTAHFEDKNKSFWLEKNFKEEV